MTLIQTALPRDKILAKFEVLGLRYQLQTCGAFYTAIELCDLLAPETMRHVINPSTLSPILTGH